MFEALRIYQYRVLENDGDGDPLDHGVVTAQDHTHALTLIAERLAGFLDDPAIEGLPVRLYPILPTPGQAGVWVCLEPFTDHTLPDLGCYP